MKTAHCLPCAALLSLLSLLAGCAATTTPVLDSHFGESVALLKAQQIMYPDAYRNMDPVSGMDGKSGVSAYQRYQKSFSTPEPQTNVFAIGVGSRQ
ncbi:pilus assembly protein [Janthinobacterium sp. BJB1]|uniref:hypothetical protein n=1 Tax=Janthinobacterium sp. GW458P TaxID=1981504 RepID=UPI000A320E80|nr:hypothetical protein [Janthinobacterium sp. GW458P]MBE3023307.1 pilus assembly protein [Janthinobacterium sp. GW458P]PHV16126.1 pilus assembly protein [Janthinobacterium sp. BJB303]PJC98449.1 pilus assembly protein [Janthinobacterium sp. BJB1]